MHSRPKNGKSLFDSRSLQLTVLLSAVVGFIAATYAIVRFSWTIGQAGLVVTMPVLFAIGVHEIVQLMRKPRPIPIPIRSIPTRRSNP